jgi:DNA-directed RNA polymerase specialized sigma24 family protein
MSPEGAFPTTHWTLIARLKSPDVGTARLALDELCAQYHYPLYCAIRHRGLGHHDAQDALHDFFAKLLRLEVFEGADAEKGRLRSYLGAALGRFLANWHRDRAGRSREVSLEAQEFVGDEARYLAERFSTDETPDRLFARQWARALLTRVLERLEADYTKRGKSVVFAVLRPVLRSGGSLRGEDTRGLAATLGKSETTLRKIHQRFLEDYRALLEAEVLQTVAGREEVEDEIAQLQATFRKE